MKQSSEDGVYDAALVALLDSDQKEEDEKVSPKKDPKTTPPKTTLFGIVACPYDLFVDSVGGQCTEHVMDRIILFIGHRIVSAG